MEVVVAHFNIKCFSNTAIVSAFTQKVLAIRIAAEKLSSLFQKISSHVLLPVSVKLCTEKPQYFIFQNICEFR
nr:hypothetical protein BAR15_10068 [Bartonella sp. AR 15-3]CBI79177.1 hypothetical protein BAR15_120216 [Bartonella sp. AR 15-3]CBI79196.1 hypothetical protein BAR15_120235 [Bartonella sp. AR 15-3]